MLSRVYPLLLDINHAESVAMQDILRLWWVWEGIVSVGDDYQLLVGDSLQTDG